MTRESIARREYTAPFVRAVIADALATSQRLASLKHAVPVGSL